jgi:hypothetical protein
MPFAQLLVCFAREKVLCVHSPTAGRRIALHRLQVCTAITSCATLNRRRCGRLLVSSWSYDSLALQAIADVIEQFDLTVRDRYVFCSSPVNTDHEALVLVLKRVRDYVFIGW